MLHFPVLMSSRRYVGNKWNVTLPADLQSMLHESIHSMISVYAVADNP